MNKGIVITTYDIGSEGGDYTATLTGKMVDGVFTVLDVKRKQYERKDKLLENHYAPIK